MKFFFSTASNAGGVKPQLESNDNHAMELSLLLDVFMSKLSGTTSFVRSINESSCIMKLD